MTLRYGLAGAGMMGREHIRSLALLPDTRVTALLEPDSNMLEQALALAPDAKPVTSFAELLAADIDALILCTPNYQHADQLLEILSIRPLPILVEKPLVTRREDVNRLLQEASPYAHLIWVGMEYRYMPPVAAFTKQLKSGAPGAVSMVSIREHRFPFLPKVQNWNRFNRWSGGTLVEKCCHFFDLMRLFTGGEAKGVFASMGQDVNHLDESYAEGVPDIADNAFVLLDFTGGKRACLDLCMFAEGVQFEQEIFVTGSRARLDCRIPASTALTGDADTLPEVTLNPRSPFGPVTRKVPVAKAPLAAGSHQGASYYQHLAFRKLAEGRGAAEVSLEDGLKAVVLGMAAQESAALGQPAEISSDGLSFSFHRG